MATLFYNQSDIRSNRPGISKAMIEFCNTTDSCLRDKMLHFFGHGASDTRDKTQCCSVCNEALLNRFDTGVLWKKYS